jgi:hypothetical protein
MENEIRNEAELTAPKAPEYKAPCVESVMSADDLAREVQYAADVMSRDPV